MTIEQLVKAKASACLEKCFNPPWMAVKVCWTVCAMSCWTVIERGEPQAYCHQCSMIYDCGGYWKCLTSLTKTFCNLPCRVHSHHILALFPLNTGRWWYKQATATITKQRTLMRHLLKSLLTRHFLIHPLTRHRSHSATSSKCKAIH